MTNDNEPMIRLEPTGTAPVISYDVPESTSYAGPNFIDLQLPGNNFIQSTGLLIGPPKVGPSRRVG